MPVDNTDDVVAVFFFMISTKLDSSSLLTFISRSVLGLKFNSSEIYRIVPPFSASVNF